MNRTFRIPGMLFIALAAVLLLQGSAAPVQTGTTQAIYGNAFSRSKFMDGSRAPFSFGLAADMREFTGPGTYDTLQYFRGAATALDSLGEAAFLLVPGDYDPVINLQWTITSTFGVDYPWYWVVGNHEMPGRGTEPYFGANMDWLRAHTPPGVNPGPAGCPETTYSFDYQDAHFVILNESCDTGGDTVTDGDISDHLYDWLAADLVNTNQPFIFVSGHEPAFPQPDVDNGRINHLGDSLDKYPARRDRFWTLLQTHGVVAYLCGHTHNHSVVNINGVWQVDVGHARGLGDTGARSTFVMIHVSGEAITYSAYRDDADGGAYTLMHTGFLFVQTPVFLPIVNR